MKHILCLFAVTVILLGTLTACGENEPSASSSTPVQDTTTTTTTTITTTTATNTTASATATENSTTTTTTVHPQSSTTTATTAVTTTTTTATTTTTTAAPEVELLDELANTKYLLTQKKALTVGYIGGSITNGTGVFDKADCWREKTTAWLKETYPAATITEINAAIGATGSYYGKNRIDSHLLEKKPDLVFIEFVVNDWIEGSNFLESAENMETMVRKCLASNPNMDIVFVYTTSVSLGGYDNLWISAFNSVARHYDIEVIDVGAAMRKSGEPLENLFVKTDKVHPNKAGYAIMAAEVSSRLTELFADAGNPTALKKHTTPALLYPLVNVNTKAYDADALHIQNPHLELMTDELTYGADKRVKLDPGDTFTFKFKGDSVGIYWYGVDPSPTGITCTLSDGRTYTRQLSKRANCIIEPLFSGLDKTKEHTITITYNGTEFLVIPYVFTTL